MFLRWGAIRVVIKYHRDAIHVEKGFRDAIRMQWNLFNNDKCLVFNCQLNVCSFQLLTFQISFLTMEKICLVLNGLEIAVVNGKFAILNNAQTSFLNSKLKIVSLLNNYCNCMHFFEPIFFSTLVKFTYIHK